MTYKARTIVQYNKDGVITQSTKSSNADSIAKAMDKAGVLYLVLNSEDVAVDGKSVDVFNCQVLDGKLVLKDVPKEEDVIENQRQKDIYDAGVHRALNQPQPIHATKLAIALSGNLSLLEDEASLKNITADELAQQIISKASEGLVSENEYQAKMLELK